MWPKNHCLLSVTNYESGSRAYPAFVIGWGWEGAKKTEGPRAGVGFLSRGQQPLPHQLGVWAKRCELPQRGSERSRDRPKVFHYFQHSGWPLLTL